MCVGEKIQILFYYILNIPVNKVSIIFFFLRKEAQRLFLLILTYLYGITGTRSATRGTVTFSCSCTRSLLLCDSVVFIRIAELTYSYTGLFDCGKQHCLGNMSKLEQVLILDPPTDLKFKGKDNNNNKPACILLL